MFYGSIVIGAHILEKEYDTFDAAVEAVSTLLKQYPDATATMVISKNPLSRDAAAEISISLI